MIVQQVLKDAAAKCDHDFRTIECSPTCRYTFSHADLVLKSVGPDGETFFHDESHDFPFTKVDLSTEYDPTDELLELYNELQFSAKAFAAMTCDTEVMTSMAELAHEDAARLLRLNYRRANVGAQRFWKSLAGLWRLRGWKRRARRYMARINLALATLEQLRSDWLQFKGIYDRSAKDENNGTVFKYEYDLSVEFISTLEIAEVRSAIGHLTESLDTRALVLATSVGAIAGAIVGALIGTII